MRTRLRAVILAVLVAASCPSGILAQSVVDADDTGNWDNLLFFGTKMAYAKDQWRASGEFQSRFKENMRELDNWFVEGAFTYLYSQKWEFVPDFRVSVKPSRTEYRLGFGINFKLQPQEIVVKGVQLVHQLKYQADLLSTGSTEHGFRQAVFLNRIATKALITTLAAGWFYRWREGFSAVEFIRFGPGVALVFNEAHTLGLSYFLGAANTGDGWTWSGIPTFQLVINLRSDWKYLPARVQAIG